MHRNNRATYGAPGVHAELGAIGIRCGSKRVARLMRQEELRGRLRGRSTTRTTHTVALQQAPQHLAAQAGGEDRDFE